MKLNFRISEILIIIEKIVKEFYKNTESSNIIRIMNI